MAFGTIMGVEVWVSWEYFGRILLPGVCLAIAAILGSIEMTNRLHPREGRSLGG